MEKEGIADAGKCSSQPHWKMLDTAFLQLSFAIKLLTYFEMNEFDKENFDIPLTVEEKFGRVCLPHNEFPTFDHILVAAENNISICYGAVAITLWEALSEKNDYEKSKPDPANSYKEMLASLSYMLRCAFAHAPVKPKWKMRSKYRIAYCVGNKHIDLTDKERQPLGFSGFELFELLRLLRTEAESCGML